MEEGWVLSIQQQCEDANVPFFFKQWGGVRKKVNGRTLQGKTHSEFPLRVTHPTLPAITRKQYAMDIEGSSLVQLT
jgi:hypothetical protein